MHRSNSYDLEIYWSLVSCVEAFFACRGQILNRLTGFMTFDMLEEAIEALK